MIDVEAIVIQADAGDGGEWSYYEVREAARLGVIAGMREAARIANMYRGYKGIGITGDIINDIESAAAAYESDVK